MNYVEQNFGVNNQIIPYSSVPEDWDGLRILVEDSNIAAGMRYSLLSTPTSIRT